MMLVSSRSAVGLALAAMAAVACAVDRSQATDDATAAATSTTAGSSAATTTPATTDQPPDPTTTGAGSSSSTTAVGPGGPCSTRWQDCPEGQKCTAVDTTGSGYWDANLCVPTPANGGVSSEPCRIDAGQPVFSGLDNCAEGYLCLNFDLMTGEGGTCHEFCDEQSQCPGTAGGDALCAASTESVVPICLALCDPLAQDCPDMQGCYGDPSLSGFICFAPYPEPNQGVDGSPCEFTNACLPGLSCQSAELVEGCDPMSTGCCTPFCLVGGGDGPCAPTEDCVPFYADPPPGLEHVGLCLLPP